MLDKNLIVEDLEPEIWMHLQEVLDELLPPLKVLHIFQRKNFVRAVTESGKILQAAPEDLEDEKRLRQLYPQADEVRIYTESGLDAYDRMLQEDFVYEMDIDEYLDYQYEILNKTDGIRIYKWNTRKRHVFSLLKEWISEDGCYLFWVTKKATLFFNCILLVENGKLARLFTSGRYPDAKNNQGEVINCLKKEFCKPVHCVTMEYGSMKKIEI
ncbi:MAG: hypothetical protein Q4C91_20725 [Eubacteriales bacterium]|nr:hypothetical protein [Eubacteriales bacterium]